MKFIFVTLFPEMIEQVAATSIIGRAQKAGLLQVSCINPRIYTHDNHRTVDDTPFGGGAGMVLKPEPFITAILAAKEQLPGARVVVMTPGGRTFKQGIAEEYVNAQQDFIFVCGHYEGFDERIFSFVDEKLSIGDFVLTGGEMPALMVMDAVARLILGVLGKFASTEEESFSSGLLEYPQYTKPASYMDMEVPEVLRNGNHQLIRQWRLKKSLIATYCLRPDMLTEEQKGLLEGTLKVKQSKGERRFWDEVRAELQEELYKLK